jgi:hypothetical protein
VQPDGSRIFAQQKYAGVQARRQPVLYAIRFFAGAKKRMLLPLGARQGLEGCEAATPQAGPER